MYRRIVRDRKSESGIFSLVCHMTLGVLHNPEMNFCIYEIMTMILSSLWLMGSCSVVMSVMCWHMGNAHHRSSQVRESLSRVGRDEKSG